MGRRAKIAIIAIVGAVGLGAVAAIFGPIIYRDFLVAPAAETPTLTAEESALEPMRTEALSFDALTGVWMIVAGSEAGYRVDEVLNGVDVTVTGRTEDVGGSLTVDGATLTEAEFEVDVASIATDRSGRDAYFRDTAMRVADHPTASFRLTDPVTASEVPEPGATIEQELTGELTLAGVTQTVSFVVQLRTDGQTAEVAGQIPITFSDYEVTAPNLGFVAVEDSGFVEFQLVLDHTPMSAG